LLHSVTGQKREEQFGGLHGTLGAKKQRVTQNASQVIEYSLRCSMIRSNITSIGPSMASELKRQLRCCKMA
jgi:hypothetical protein